MSDLQQFYKDYKTNRKFKSGDVVFYYNEDIGWVHAIILRKHDKVFADLAFILEDNVLIHQFVSTQLLTKLDSSAVESDAPVKVSETQIQANAQKLPTLEELLVEAFGSMGEANIFRGPIINGGLVRIR